jgi:beta-mannosidase
MKVVILIVVSFFSFHLHSQLTLNWTIFHPIKKEWIEAGSCASVQEILIKNGELPDPFVGLNEKNFDWIENYEWEYRSIFHSDSIDFNKSKIALVLPWVDTYARIYLNDNLILETSNSFLPYSVQIKEYIKSGENQIRVIFIPPILKHKNTSLENGIYYPAPNDVADIQVAPLVRKPQFQFGWDWTMRMNTLGFIKPVSIDFYDVTKINNTLIEVSSIKEDTAIMNMKMYLKDAISGDYIVESYFLGRLNEVVVEQGVVNTFFEIPHPKLWWPRGQGDQNIYTDTLVLKTRYGKIIDTKIISFGVRTSELIQEKDSLGTSYYFKINNRPIFCKGANLIPMDIFPSRVSEEKMKDLVLQMVKSNFNIVRVWGGGYYLDDYFYELCDKYGIMVWQDCMFACAMYPSNDEFIDNIKQEIVYQIPRIAAHPSVIQFNGNNEVDVAWKFWGFQNRYSISEANQLQIVQDYNRIFKQVIPEIIHSITNIPYVHTSPLGHWINPQDFPHGTQHYWGVWHGKDPIEDFGKKSGRFNAEYGFQSFPEYNALRSFSEFKDWSLNSEVMKSHQKSYVGNGMIKKHADILYGACQNFEDFVYYSQLTQAKAVGIAISSHRLLSPACMGTIYWQLNDCWPAPTWSSIDYYGNWKALQYRAREDYKEVTVLEKTQKLGRETYFFVSDSPDTFQTSLKYEVYNLWGKKIIAETRRIQVFNGIKIPVFKQNLLTNFLKTNYFVRFEWTDRKGLINKREFIHLGNKINYKKALRNSFKIELIDIDTLTRTATIKLKSTVFLADFWISSNKKGVQFETNFFSMLPGTKEIKINFTELPSLEDFKFKWR